MRYTPEWMDGQSIAAYYRKYDEKTPWVLANAATGGYRAVYSTGAEMLGLGFDGKLGPVAIGAELGFHKNVGLTTTALSPVNEGAKGNTWHAVLNGTYGLPTTPLWETGTFVAELNYTHLDKVTANGALFNRVGAASCMNRSGAVAVAGDANDGCATSSAWGLNVSFTPEYPQLYPGVNVAVPMTLGIGLKGNSPSALGAAEGVKTYSIGVRAMVQNKHQFDLIWAASKAPMRVSAAGVATGGNGAFANNDRGRILLTYKTSF